MRCFVACQMTEPNRSKTHFDTESWGASLIAHERKRQIETEGWTPEHDDAHTLGELAAAGACYALLATRWRDSSILGRTLIRAILWPWEAKWFKPAEYG